jgi:23S rRNA (guanine745-N1)-methyltransferase
MPALAAVAPHLRCPVCGGPLALDERALACPQGHRYDVARQGHVSLPAPRGRSAAGDPAAMVAARAAFLDAGYYAPIARAVADAARAAGPPAQALVADLGAGTGYHLAAVLEALPRAHGIALDASRPALRRAARAHPRIAAVVCDVWRELPLQDAAADLVLDVFAPRNGGEIVRVLAPDGALIVVTPTPAHLRELVDRLGMLGVDPDKPARLQAELAPLRAVDRRPVEFAMELGAGDAQALVAMGPSGHHLQPEDVRERLGGGTAAVTASVTVETFRR